MKISGFQDTINWYNQNAKQYAQASIAAYNVHDQEQFDQFTQMLSRGAKILDAGCGSGRDTHAFTQAGFEAIGLDLSSGLIAEAKQRFPDSTFLEGNLLSLPFEAESFDGVWSHASLLHLETITEVQQALNEFQRVLKPEGVLAALVKAQTSEAETAVVSDKVSGHDRFFHYYTSDNLQGLLSEANFEILEIRQFNEADRNPKGRREVEWIVAFGKKS